MILLATTVTHLAIVLVIIWTS